MNSYLNVHSDETLEQQIKRVQEAAIDPRNASCDCLGGHHFKGDKRCPVNQFARLSSVN
jgi:hypothetical protein